MSAHFTSVHTHDFDRDLPYENEENCNKFVVKNRSPYESKIDKLIDKFNDFEGNKNAEDLKNKSVVSPSFKNDSRSKQKFNYHVNDPDQDNSSDSDQFSDILNNAKAFPGRFAARIRKYSPATTEFGENIINKLKDQYLSDPDMIYRPVQERSSDNNMNNQNDGDDWFNRDFFEMGQNPRFRMNSWMSDEDEMDFPSRGPHSPRFYSLGRPRRDRKLSSESYPNNEKNTGRFQRQNEPSSSTSSHAIRIPIALEADAPPGWHPENADSAKNVECKGSPVNQHDNVSRTKSAVGNFNARDLPRDARCSSEPPEIPKKSVSNVQNSSSSDNVFNSKPVFNNVPKPFVPGHNPIPSPIAEEPVTDFKDFNNRNSFSQNFEPQPRFQPNSQTFPGRKSNEKVKKTGVRSIPIVFEDSSYKPSTPSPRNSQFRSQHEKNDPGSQYESEFNFSPSFRKQSREPFFDRPPKNVQQTQQPRQSNRFKTNLNQNVDSQNATPSREPVVSKESAQENVKLELVNNVKSTVDELKCQIENFKGTEKNKEFLYIDEMLTRALLKLDNIDPDGQDDVRQARRSLVKEVNKAISELESKIAETPEKPLSKSRSRISCEEMLREGSPDVEMLETKSSESIEPKDSEIVNDKTNKADAAEELPHIDTSNPDAKVTKNSETVEAKNVDDEKSTSKELEKMDVEKVDESIELAKTDKQELEKNTDASQIDEAKENTVVNQELRENVDKSINMETSEAKTQAGTNTSDTPSDKIDIDKESK